MSETEKDFRQKLLAIFKIEAAEHLKTMQAALFDLERPQTPQDRLKLTEIMFREAHSLKGAARAVDREAIETVCQSLESFLSPLSRGSGLSAEAADTVNQMLDMLSRLVVPAADTPPVETPVSPDTGYDRRAAPRPPLQEDTVRISARRLHAVLIQAEEL